MRRFNEKADARIEKRKYDTWKVFFVWQIFKTKHIFFGQKCAALIGLGLVWQFPFDDGSMHWCRGKVYISSWFLESLSPFTLQASLKTLQVAGSAFNLTMRKTHTWLRLKSLKRHKRKEVSTFYVNNLLFFSYSLSPIV